MENIESKRYDSNILNSVGDTLIEKTASEEEKNNAMDILYGWRAKHIYPMQVFNMRLRGVAKKIDKNALTVRRLKRVPAILFKLGRDYPSRKQRIKLSEMQDIGGCRTVLSNVSMVMKLYEKWYKNGDLKHKKVKVNDYITHPKPDGYRSLHIVYNYQSDKAGKMKYNDLLIEIQIRSKIQHYWATAIETVGFFTRQAIKLNEGSDSWKDFFKLTSSAFAKMEGCRGIEGTPDEERELYLRIKKRERELNAINKMDGWMTGTRYYSEEIKKREKNIRYFLLELDIPNEKLLITAYSKKREQEAINDYSALEKKHSGKPEFDVVLVGADTFAELETAYPNYFVDTSEFLKLLKSIVNKYNE